MSGNRVRVGVKIRPLISHEIDSGAEPVVKKDAKKIRVSVPAKNNSFEFDWYEILANLTFLLSSSLFHAGLMDHLTPQTPCTSTLVSLWLIISLRDLMPQYSHTAKPEVGKHTPWETMAIVAVRVLFLEQ